MNFVKEVKFDRLGVFTYSKEEGTPAYKLDNQVLQKVKKTRQKIIMEEQQKISLTKNKEKIGNTIDVLVEGKLSNGTFFGRTYQDSPEVDGLAFIETDNELGIGEYYKCKVIGAKEYDIIVEVI